MSGASCAPAQCVNVSAGGAAPVCSNQMAGVAQGLLEEKMGAGLKDISVAAGQLKYYFQVDTRYVMKKIGLLLFPFIPGVSPQPSPAHAEPCCSSLPRVYWRVVSCIFFVCGRRGAW